MSDTLPISANSIVWNENTVLEQGNAFLNQKNNELKIYQAFWDASLGTDYYNSSARTTARQFKAIAEESRKEIKALDDIVIELLNQEVTKNPQSEKTQQLLKIYTASHAALNYFTSVVNDTYFPTYFNQSIRDSFIISGKAAFSAALLTGAAYLAKEVTSLELPDTAYIPVKLAVSACIAATAIRILNQALRIQLSDQRVTAVKELFEKALYPTPKTAAAV